MKTVLVVLASLVALAAASSSPKQYDVETKTVDAKFVEYQKKVFYLFQHITQNDPTAEYYKIGKEYDIVAHADNYTNKKAFEEFMLYFRHGMLPQNYVFSIFYDRMREEAIALYHLFYFAKDFETFYKTACWARVHLNEGMFTYSFSIALRHRTDCAGLIIPAPYEVYPYFFVNSDVISKMYHVKMVNGEIDEKFAYYYGITHQDNVFTVYANYSSYHTYDNEDQRLSYFTEDIGLNTYYYYFHTALPFWMKGEQYGVLKERRGEFYFYFHQQLLARYYMERLTNGLGEIPEFSWRFPIKTGYEPNMVYHNMMPFVQRDNYYHLQTPKNVEELEYLESYENQFFQYLHEGSFNAFNFNVDFKNSKAVNFVGNYWQSNVDLYEKAGYQHYQQYYEIIARVLLGASADPNHHHHAAPVALEQFETALRDPAFYQLYKRVLFYFLQYKQYLEPYTRENLHYVGVKINDVKVDRLVTFFDFFDFDGTNGVFFKWEQFSKMPYYFHIRQPRLNHKSFNVNIEIKSDVNAEAMIKIFMAPKYDSNGHPISLEDNWMNFVELDLFKYKLTQGQNTIVRNSEDFFNFKEDSIPAYEVLKMLDSGKVPVDMSEYYRDLPNRLMLPKGTTGGFPFQFFVYVYQYTPLPAEYEPFKSYFLDTKPFGYPFDRPLNELYFHQPNMFFKDVVIYHEGEQFYYKYNVPGFPAPKY